MNTLSNGSIAVGAPGSWARFASAYEDELYKAIESHPEQYAIPLDRKAISLLVDKMMLAAMCGNAHLSSAIKAAAKAADAQPTIKGIMNYLKAAAIGRRGRTATMTTIFKREVRKIRPNAQAVPIRAVGNRSLIGWIIRDNKQELGSVLADSSAEAWKHAYWRLKRGKG